MPTVKDAAAQLGMAEINIRKMVSLGRLALTGEEIAQADIDAE